MSKNKKASVAIVFACLMVSAFAQAKRPMEAPFTTSHLYQAPPIERPVMTVDELINSGKLSQVGQRPRVNAEGPLGLGSVNPSVDGELPKKDDTLPMPNPNAMSLAGIYMSSQASTVAIEAKGTQKMYVAGDVVTGGWRVLRIETQGVDLARCVKGKCTSKFLLLNE
jgi:type II secretory pathway component PulC